MQGEYREARLYSVDPGGGFVLVVHRPSGALERHMLTTDGRSTLRNAVDAGMATVGRPTADVAVDIVSEPAGSAFARHQTLLGAVVYGPLAASLADGRKRGRRAVPAHHRREFLHFIQRRRRSYSFTRAQSDLAGNLGLAAPAAQRLLGYAATGDGEEKECARSRSARHSLERLRESELGRTLSDAEAHGATLGIEAAAAMALSVDDYRGRVESHERGDRRARRSARLSDRRSLSETGIVHGDRRRHRGHEHGRSSRSARRRVGAGRDRQPKRDHRSPRISARRIVGGLLLGDALLARPFDLTPSQANIVNIGAFAGALVGLRPSGVGWVG